MGFFKRLQKALKVSERKPTSRILLEYLKFKIFNPPIAEQYFKKYLFKKDIENFQNYVITHKVLTKMWELNNLNKNYYSILSNKYNTEQFFSEYNLPVVKSIARNDGSLFFSEGKITQINDYKNFMDFLLTLRKTGLWQEEHLIIKKLKDTHGGKNIFKISETMLKENQEKISSVFNIIQSGGYLFQNRLRQHPALDQVNPYSVNTLRVDTFMNKSGNAEIFSTFLRTSSSKVFVDNAFSGGLFIGIHPETGRLYKEGFTDFEKGTGQTYLTHPQTGLVFENHQIPCFDDIRKLAKDAAAKLPRLRIIAWDIAVTPDGPVIIEGNYFSGSGLFNSELTQKGFGNNKVFAQILEEI